MATLAGGIAGSVFPRSGAYHPATAWDKRGRPKLPSRTDGTSGLQELRNLTRLRSLEAFRHVYETGSVTRASERMGVSQPAISQTIFALEKAIGAKLFERAGARRLAPTPEGRLVYPTCCEVLEALMRFETAAREAGSGGRITIGAVPSVAIGFAADAIDRLRGEYPQIQVHLDPRYPGNLEPLLVAGALDVAISTEPGTGDKVDTEHLATVPIVAAVPAGHRLAARSSLGPADFDGESVATLTRTSRFRSLIDRMFSEAGHPLVPAIEAPGFTLCDFVGRGQAIGIMGAVSAWSHRDRAMVILPLLPAVGWEIFLLRRRGVEPHPFLASFRADLQAQFDAVKAALPSLPAAGPGLRRPRRSRPV